MSVAAQSMIDASMAFDEEDNKIIDSFECIDTFIQDQDAFDNAIVSLQNSNISSFSKVECSCHEEKERKDMKVQIPSVAPSMRENFM
jgi:hypothetical protein